MTKTLKEIEDLKRNWKSDPCWDIEDTEGFEEHRNELAAWRKAYEQERENIELARLQKKADELKCSVELLQYIEFLEYKISQLQR